jgi:hypothetical protein
VNQRGLAERTAVLLFALARTGVCAYRAATQSITVDEATTYLNYVREHWANVWANYDPNNHILYSILAQLSVRAFRISEFSLRLPSVLAGFFLVIGIHRVLEQTVESRAVRWIALVGLSTAPLMLDFSVAARGYGLGLALLVWAIYFSVRGRDVWAGVFAGLSIASTFNLAYSTIGLVACPLILDAGKFSARMRRSLAAALPAAGIFLAICYPALRQVKTSQLYVGDPTIAGAVYNLVFLTIRAIPGHPGWFGTGAGTRAIQYFFLLAVLVFVIGVSARTFRGKEYSRRSLVPVLALLLALAAIVCAHFFAGLNYPVDRLGLHLFLLFGLAWAIAASQAPKPRIRALNALLATLLIAQFLTQFHTRYFALWQFDMPMKQVARLIEEEVRGAPAGSVSVSATWFHVPALEYYRRVYRIAALQPIERHEHTQLDGFDYYVLNVKDDDDLKSAPIPKVIPLFRDDFSGVLLYK